MGKRIFIVIIVFFACNLAMGQDLNNLNILLERTEKETVYLVNVSKPENHSIDLEDGRSDIYLSYKLRVEQETETKFYMSEKQFSAHFIPGASGLYEIKVLYGGGTHFYRERPKNEGELTMWREGIRETSPGGKWNVIGLSSLSSDATLLPVRVLNCYRELKTKK